MTIENLAPEDARVIYAINCSLCKVGDDEAYFHAQFRRTNPLPYKEDYVIVDNIRGRGIDLRKIKD